MHRMCFLGFMEKTGGEERWLILVTKMPHEYL